MYTYAYILYNIYNKSFMHDCIFSITNKLLPLRLHFAGDFTGDLPGYLCRSGKPRTVATDDVTC